MNFSIPRFLCSLLPNSSFLSFKNWFYVNKRFQTWFLASERACDFPDSSHVWERLFCMPGHACFSTSSHIPAIFGDRIIRARNAAVSEEKMSALCPRSVRCGPDQLSGRGQSKCCSQWDKLQTLIYPLEIQ